MNVTVFLKTISFFTGIAFSECTPPTTGEGKISVLELENVGKKEHLARSSEEFFDLNLFSTTR